jgi:D-inositol-3-phosphate glycosyltransferase
MISFHTCPLASQEGKETGGMNVYVLELAKALSRRGIAVDVFTRSQDDHIPHLVQVDPHFRVIHVVAGVEGTIPKKQLIDVLPEFVANMRAFIAAEGVRYDIVHAHYYLSGLAALDWLGEHGRTVPLFITFHTLALMKNLVARDELEREEKARIDAEFRLVGAVDRIIAPSAADRDYLRYLYGADGDRVHVVPPGVDLAHFKPIDQGAARAALGITQDDRLILFCGRIEPLKGIDMLLYALRVLIERAPGIAPCLWIIGGDVSQPPEMWSKELQKLERLRHLLRLTSIVRFAGQQPQDVLPLYYSAADMLVMPSHYESFGMAAAEAMACGTPVITTNATGISDLIDDEQNALLITSVNNPLLLASQMERLLTDSDARRAISRAVTSKVRDLDWTTVSDRILTLYAASLAENAHS